MHSIFTQENFWNSNPCPHVAFCELQLHFVDSQKKHHGSRNLGGGIWSLLDLGPRSDSDFRRSGVLTAFPPALSKCIE